MTNKTRVLIIDDSPFVCRLLTSHLQSAEDVVVVGTALNGRRGIKLAAELQPDVITLDLEMPKMGGFETLQQIMHDNPTPIVVISGVSRRAARLSLAAINAGAVDFVLKYTPGADKEPDALRQEILAKVKAAASIKVVRSIRPRQARAQVVNAPQKTYDNSPTAKVVSESVNEATGLAPAAPPKASLLPGGIVVIGASTGGPVAVRELLDVLPPDFPAAIIVVQHMPASFTGALAAQLDNRVALRVKEAETGDLLVPGQVLVAPGDYHLLLRTTSRVYLNQAPKIQGHRPSIDVTMQSVAQVYGMRSKGVVLTGMGGDGSMGLMAIQSKGGETYAQDAASCVVNGMPQRAIEQGVVDFVAPPSEIGRLLWESVPWQRTLNGGRR